MKKRAKASVARAEARRPKAAKLKRQSDLGQVTHSASVEGGDAALLIRELKAAREQQAATANVLKVISRSAFDLDTVLNTLVKSAADLCDAEASSLALKDGDKLIIRGVYGLDEKEERFVRESPAQIDETSYMGRAVLHRTLANIPDFTVAIGSRLRKYQEKLGFKAMLVVPLMRDGQSIGVFNLTAAGSVRSPKSRLISSKLSLLKLSSPSRTRDY